ncbi:LysR family transcriptional regulator [Pseudomonas fulva]|nr:LysR family transcriptional regulator [Pseudomonas fulva]MBF8780386.1 LysR family transcriptional regulator [Pseudomonas fulva]
MKLTLRQLDIFRAIAQCGSTTSASVFLALSQSATSSALHELERALDVRLFDRVGKRLVLNDNGRKLFPQAVRLLEAAAQIEETFLSTDTVTRLRIGCSTTIGNYIMPCLAESLSQRTPGLRVDVSMGNSADVARQAAQLSIDMALIEGPCHLPELTVKPWFEDELLVIAAASDPLAHNGAVTWNDLREAPWLIRESGSGTAEEVLRFLLPRLGEWSNTREIGSSEAIKRMVAAGLGISCLSYWVVSDLLAQGQLVVLNKGDLSHKRQLYAVHHRDKFMSPALKLFQQALADFAADQAA